jgi:hypothetical protein
MISLWVVARESDVEAYAATLLLPSWLAHLELAPLRFAEQAPVCDGREPLVLTYVGEGRLERYGLDPREHALGLIRFLSPGVDSSRIQLPQDDAAWLWPDPADPHAMRVYFSATSQVLNQSSDEPVGQQAYVSVSQKIAFVGRPVVQRYLRAWLGRLAIAPDGLALVLGGVSGALEFQAGPVAGQMLVDDEVSSADLLRFAGLDRILAELSDTVTLDPHPPRCEPYGVRDDGVYLRLVTKSV